MSQPKLYKVLCPMAYPFISPSTINMKFSTLFLVLLGVFVCCVAATPASHRVRRGHGGAGISIGGSASVVDGISVGAVSGGNNAFVWSHQAGQNFLASSGWRNYLQQQGGLQAAAAAGAGAAWAGLNYDHIATGPNLPSNVAGYQGFPSYG